MDPTLHTTPQEIPHNQRRQYAIPLSWQKVKGSLKGLKIDGVTYQKNIRSEWEKRLARQIKLGTKKRGHRH